MLCSLSVEGFLPSQTQLAPIPHCSFGLSPSPSPQTGSPPHQHSLPSVWLHPFRFSHMTPPSPLCLLSGWPCFTQMPPNHCPVPYHPQSTSSDVSLSPGPCSLSFSRSLFFFSSRSPTAQMPGSLCNSCLAMCHHQVLPPIAGQSWEEGGGGAGGGCSSGDGGG